MAEISNEPNSVTLVIVQGSDLSFGVTITDTTVDFTGATARMKIMTDFATRAIVKALTVTVDAATNGLLQLTIGLTAAETAALSNLTPGERRQPLGVQDLEVVLSGGRVLRYMQGSAVLSREATV